MPGLPPPPLDLLSTLLSCSLLELVSFSLLTSIPFAWMYHSVFQPLPPWRAFGLVPV